MPWSPVTFIPSLTFPAICMILGTETLRMLYKHHASAVHVAEGSGTPSTYADLDTLLQDVGMM